MKQPARWSRLRSIRWRVGALVVVLALVGAACNGVDEDIGPTDVGGSIEVAAVWSAGEQRSFEAVLDEFTTRTGTRVSYTSTGDDIPTFLRTRIEGGDPPGVALVAQPGLMVDLVAQGALVPIDDVVGDTVDASYAESWREIGSVDGVLYGVFFKGANKSTVWYNVDAFDDAGVTPPQTWEELMTVASTLDDAGITPFAIGGADGWVLTDWFENIYIRTAGPESYDQLTDHEIPWTDESVIEALEVFAEVLADASLTFGTPTTVSFEESVDAVFGDPAEAAMVYEGDFVPGVTDIAQAAQPGVDYDVFDFPSIEGSPPAVVGAGDMAIMLEDTPQARALIEFLASPEAAEIWAVQGGFSSPNQDVDPDVYPDEITRQTATALAEAEVFRFDLSDLVPPELGGDLPGSMWGILQDFASDPSDPQATAEQLEAAAQRAFG